MINEGDSDLVENVLEEPESPTKPEFNMTKPKKLPQSTYEKESVGRILFSFEKPEDYRWKRLNMQEFGIKHGSI